MTDKRRLPEWQKPDFLYLILPVVGHGGFLVTRERRYDEQAAYIPEPTRCRDCVSANQLCPPSNPQTLQCMHPRGLHRPPQDGSGYCSYGEPKKGE